MRLTVFSFALAAVPSSALAQDENDPGPANGPFSVFGGRLLGNGESAVSAGIGWPGIYAEYDQGVTPQLDVGVRADLLYGSPTASVGSLVDTDIGLSVSVPARLEISDARPLAIAAGLRPSFYVGDFRGSVGSTFGERGVQVGFGIEPSVLFTLALGGSLNVIGGASVPVFFLPLGDPGGLEVFVPVVPFAGAEVGLADDLNLSFLLRLGPAFHIHEPEGDLRALFGLLVGIEHRL